MPAPIAAPVKAMSSPPPGWCVKSMVLDHAHDAQPSGIRRHRHQQQERLGSRPVRLLRLPPWFMVFLILLCIYFSVFSIRSKGVPRSLHSFPRLLYLIDQGNFVFVLKNPQLYMQISDPKRKTSKDVEGAEPPAQQSYHA